MNVPPGILLPGINTPAAERPVLDVIGSMAWAATIAPSALSHLLELRVAASLAEAAGLAPGNAGWFVVLEVTAANGVSAIEWIQAARVARPGAVIVGVGRHAVRYEWALREAGAVAIFPSTWQACGLWRLLHRFLAAHPIEPRAHLVET